LGLPADLRMWSRAPVHRRRLLKLGVLSVGAFLTGCSSSDGTGNGGDGCASEIPEETAGPYPADGSQQEPNVLERTGIVRSDIGTSLESGNTAEGVPITIELQLVDTSADCAPLVGYAVYLWHCNRAGEYSLYSTAVTAEDYLRGVQETDSEGKVGFTQSVETLSQISLSSDNVFGEDEAELQLATVTGSVEAGYSVALTAGLATG
jgi:hypothetical protein